MKRLTRRRGANRCQHLTNCVPGTCYSIIDRTQSIETDDVPRVLPDSFFSSVVSRWRAKKSARAPPFMRSSGSAHAWTFPLPSRQHPHARPRIRTRHAVAADTTMHTRTSKARRACATRVRVLRFALRDRA